MERPNYVKYGENFSLYRRKNHLREKWKDLFERENLDKSDNRKINQNSKVTVSESDSKKENRTSIWRP